MNVNNFVDKLKWVAGLNTKYKMGGWGQHSINGEVWYFDCVCLVKSILWGFSADINDKNGGAKYASNGVPDIGTEQMISVCNNVSNDFTNIQVGELVYMRGHVGVYIGNRQVVESTGAWNKKVVISNVSSNGTRSKDNAIRGKWLKHGYLPYVDYTSGQESQPQPTNDWTSGLYKLTNSKYLRTTPQILANNFVLVKNTTQAMRSALTSTNPNAKAKIKSGITITALDITMDNAGRIYCKNYSGYVCLCDKNGIPQAIKVG